MNRRTLAKLLGAAALNHALFPYERSFAQSIIQANHRDVFRSVPPEQSGISWIHDNARSNDRYLPETTGAGCAFLDYDNDGWMDIFLVNSGPCYFYQPSVSPSCALYRNNRDGTFTDVTVQAGVQGGFFGMGVAVADYDRDGFQDIFLTGFEKNILYHNNGDGTFTDVTVKAGLSDTSWSSSAVWFDYDNDGLLDLFVCHYVEFKHRTQDLCGSSGGSKIYCAPQNFPAVPSRLYHNNGDGTFTDVSARSGISANVGKALGVVAADINNDGWMDLFVSNDTTANWLYLNSGHGTFTDIGFEADVAYDDDGSVRSGMGVDAADFDHDGKIDLFVANIDHQRYALYKNLGDNRFANVSTTNDIGRSTMMMSGWGAHFIDYDNDGWPDMLCVNGHPDDLIDRTGSLVKFMEHLLLFHNDGKSFTDVSEQGGSAFRTSWSARGLAIGDFNNDGAMDALVLVNGGRPLLLENVYNSKNAWLGIFLTGVRANTDAIGARIRWSAGGQKYEVQKTSGGGFLSSHDPRVVLGLGDSKKVDWLEVQWPHPSGAVERFTDVPINKYVSITEGAGKLLPYPAVQPQRPRLRPR
jgi:hypothetical protein